MGENSMELNIPTDIDGFVLLQCQLCGEFFKLRADEIQADDVIEIWCPCCGLKADNYITEDVLELAIKIASNKIMEGMYKEIKKVETRSSGKGISLKVSSKLEKEEELPIMQGINALDIEKYYCCKKVAKIKPIVKMVGSYCPYCGVRLNGNK